MRNRNFIQIKKLITLFWGLKWVFEAYIVRKKADIFVILNKEQWPLWKIPPLFESPRIQRPLYYNAPCTTTIHDSEMNGLEKQ